MNLKESLETIKDSRIDRCKKHSLVDILMIVFFGLLCRYNSEGTGKNRHRTAGKSIHRICKIRFWEQNQRRGCDCFRRKDGMRRS